MVTLLLQGCGGRNTCRARAAASSAGRCRCSVRPAGGREVSCYSGCAAAAAGTAACQLYGPGHPGGSSGSRRHCNLRRRTAGDRPCSENVCSRDRSSGQVVPALMAYLRAALAAIPRQPPPPPRQAYKISQRAASSSSSSSSSSNTQLGQRRPAPRCVILSAAALW